MSEQSPVICENVGPDTRRPWITPDLRTMRAGSAEEGPNPNVPEGPIAFGS